MSLREAIHIKPVITGGLGAAALVFAAIVVFHQTLGQRRPNVQLMNLAFYSDDDGKSWFIDDIAKVPPFDHEGKTAVRAAVFRSGAGKLFVGYLEKFSDEQQAEINAAIAARPKEKNVWLNSTMMAKKPGESAWASTGMTATPQQIAAYQKATTVVSPDGSGGAVPVSPRDDYAVR